MASGATHRAVAAGAALVLALAVGAATQDHVLALAAGAGCYGGRYIHPDWDQNHSAPWWRRPYALMIRHRSPLSHWPVVGTLGRLAYLIVPPGLVAEAALFALGWRAPLVWLDWRDLALGAAAVGGLMVSDTLHWVLDWPVWRTFRQTQKRYR
jgi:uncharacterized metal-binding protein